MRSTSADSERPRAGAATYYDGASARARAVDLTLEPDGIAIAASGAVLANWPYAAVRRRDAPQEILRLANAGGPELARLDIADPALAAEVVRRAGRQLGEAHTGAGTILLIVFWSLVAVASLVGTAVYIVPAVADRLAPLVPIALEQRLGQAADNQVRALIGRTTCSTPDGSAALAALTNKLSAKASLPMPVDVRVLRSTIPNAFALPGGRIYLLSALLERAENVDEVAGVLAHEMGHVAHRDGLRVLIQNGGTSFLLGLLFGDVTGGTPIIFVSKTLVNSAYSRDAERAADDYAAGVMRGLGRSPRPLGLFLARLMKREGGEPRVLAFLESHPTSSERLAALSNAEPASPGPTLLSEAEWQSLRAICRTARTNDRPTVKDERPARRDARPARPNQGSTSEDQ
jgi:Zn-dependent protease with chaperone function